MPGASTLQANWKLYTNPACNVLEPKPIYTEYCFTEISRGSNDCFGKLVVNGEREASSKRNPSTT